MKLIRIILCAFCFATFGIGGFFIGSSIFPIVTLFTPKNKQRLILANIVHHSWRIFVWFMCFCKLINVKVNNVEKVKFLKKTVIISNHPSLIDIVLLISTIPNSVCIVKGSLSNNIFMKHIIRKIHILNDENVFLLMEQAQKAISEGLNIIIFPEGTRTNLSKKDNKKLQRGFAQIAIKCNSNILPIHISSDPKILGKNQKWYDLGDKTSLYTLSIKDEITVPFIDENNYRNVLFEIINCAKLKIF